MTTKIPAPSTQWHEVIAADEDAQLATYVAQFADLQKRKSALFGPGRALHRRQVLGARAVFEVLPDLPAFLGQGLFAQAKRYQAMVRLSNGGMDKAADSQPDIRGFSIAVQGVHGASALDNGPAKLQCFALINQSQFGFAKASDFMDFVVAASHGKAHLLKFLVKRYGLLAGPKRLLKLAATLSKPFAGFANESFFSAAPIACGPFAVRVRLTPSPDNGKPSGTASRDWGADVAQRLLKGPLHYQLELQPYTLESITPIEDASVDWPSPYTPVARLTLPQQDIGADPELAKQVENGIFDPWAALAAHRPLGNVMRARKVIYFESQKGRGAV